MTEDVQTHHGSTQWACSTVRGPSHSPNNVLSMRNLLKTCFIEKCPEHADGQRLEDLLLEMALYQFDLLCLSDCWRADGKQ